MRAIVFILMLMLPLGAHAENMRVKIGTELATVIMTSVVAPDTPSGPNEDPQKCPCKGSGIIVHGDGHTTKCPFHSKGSAPKKPVGTAPTMLAEPEPIVKTEIVEKEEKVEDDGVFFEKKCNCEDCDCGDCGCLTGECKCPSCVEVATAQDKEAEEMPALTFKDKYDYVLYHMGAEWCIQCEKMLNEVWPNDGVSRTGRKTDTNDDMKKFLEDNRISLKILDKTKPIHAAHFKYYKEYMRQKDKNGNRVGTPRYPTILLVSVGDYNTPVVEFIGGYNKSRTMKVLKEFLDED